MGRYLLLSLGIVMSAWAVPAWAAAPAPSCFTETFTQMSPTLADFRLSVANVDTSTLAATVDGVAVSVTYVAARNEAHLDLAGAPDATVELNYCLPSHQSGCQDFGCSANGI